MKTSMIFREAVINDIKQIQIVRNLVKENVLSSPALVSDKDCEDFLSLRGKGWVCEIEKKIVGFAIADLKEKNIWALFVLPEYENKGIGKRLHSIMLDWYFSQIPGSVWLSTSPGTRAEIFYRKHGWTETGVYGKDEIKFEMNSGEWKKLKDCKVDK